MDRAPSWTLILVGLAVFALAWGGIGLTMFGGQVASIWLANALLLAVLLRHDERAWPGVFLTGFVAGVAADLLVGGASVPAALILPACNALEVAVAAYGLRRWRQGRLDLSVASDLAAFALLAGLVAPALTAAAAAGYMAIALGVGFVDVWTTWFPADALGILIVTPLLLTVRGRDVRALITDRLVWPLLGTVAAVLAIAGGVFVQGQYPLLFLAFPAAVFAALAFGSLGAAAAVAAVSLVAIPATLAGMGPLALIDDAGPQGRVLLLQAYLAVLVLTTLPVAAVLAGHRRLETRLQAALEGAKAGERAKANFLAVMSHEIRTPLTGVIGTTDLLVRQDLPPKARRYARSIHNSGRQLLALVDDILDFLRLGEDRLSLHEADFSLAETLGEIEAILGPSALDKGLTLNVRVDANGIDRLRADPTRLKQILFNLAGNGLKFTREGGVEVRARVEGEEGALCLRVAVQDTGIGVPPDKQALLFEPFAQADGTLAREHDGAGLGLAICQKLVDLMGGKIGFESTPGAGSRFWFEVPVRAGDEAAAHEARPHAPTRGLKILLAEDVPLNQELITEVLRDGGHHVVVAENGAALLERAEERRFDCLLVDIQMPVLDGEEAVRRLRAAEGPNRATPAVALTANVMEQDHARFLAAGMDTVLTKPIVWPELFDALRRLTAPAGGRPEAPASTNALNDAFIEALAGTIPPGRLDGFLDKALVEARAAAADFAAGPSIDSRRRLAHRMKGTCRNFGLAAIGDAAEALEEVGTEDVPPERLEAFKAAVERTARALAARV